MHSTFGTLHLAIHRNGGRRLRGTVRFQRGMTKKKPVPVADLLKSYLADTEVGERIEEASVVPEWAERVGPAIAAVTVPLRVNRGTLLVGVRSSAWLMELTVMEGQILRRLNADRARGKISKIRFQMLAG